jgi:hypothetical protein
MICPPRVCPHCSEGKQASWAHAASRVIKG